MTRANTLAVDSTLLHFPTWQRFIYWHLWEPCLPDQLCEVISPHCHQVTWIMLPIKPIQVFSKRNSQKSPSNYKLNQAVISYRSHTSSEHKKTEPIWKNMWLSRICNWLPFFFVGREALFVKLSLASCGCHLGTKM